MKKNMGTIDRAVRFLFAAIVAALYFAGLISGTATIVLAIVAAVLLATSFVGTCPAYLPFGWSTRGSKAA